jgi:hypothetical protein
MPNYEKLTLEGFKLKLNEGKYESLTGARRAIGKVTDWSAKDKQKAQELAAAHFGEDGGKPSAKPAKTPKKAAKAGPKKIAAGPKKVAAKKAAPKSKAAAVKSSPVRSPVEVPKTPDELRLAAQESLAFAGTALERLSHARNLDPSVDIKAGVADANGIINNALGFMSRAIQGLPHPGTPVASVAPRIDLEAVKEEEAEEPAALAKEETVEDVQAGDDDLTPQERQSAELLASKAAGIGALGLPRPV